MRTQSEPVGGGGVFTIILTKLVSFFVIIIITTITIRIIRIFTEDGGMMMAVTIDLRDVFCFKKNSTKAAERV